MWCVTLMLVMLATTTVVYTQVTDLQPIRLVITSPNPATYQVDTELDITFDVTVMNDGPENLNSSDSDNFYIQLYLSDYYELDSATATQSVHFNVTLPTGADLSQNIDAGSNIELAQLTAMVTIPRKYCPLLNYVCVLIVVEDSMTTNNDWCIKFGSQVEGKAGEKQCPETASQQDIDNGVNVVLSSFSMTLYYHYLYLFSDNTADIISHSEVLVANGYPRRIHESLSILTIVEVQSSNQFCSAASGFYLPRDALLMALQQSSSDFTAADVQEVVLGELFTEDENETSVETMKARDLEAWKIVVIITSSIFVIAGLATLAYIAYPAEVQKVRIEIPLSAASTVSKKHGIEEVENADVGT
uniref:Uncharacterized protein LOC100378562 n=1 Tax=Saccoglossus kowalevskii TaxID=10224 RepID=A0ABM0M2S5_SACKO|nr:PREDICTED: uncharacterized protein LOC100378562 [Saccoglossus kowalevskii]